MFKILQTTLFLFIIHNLHASLHAQTIDSTLHALERAHHIKIGLYALDTNSKQTIAYHANDRFPFQSTCKFMGVSALLASQEALLQKKCSYALKSFCSGTLFQDNTPINMSH